MPPGRLGISFAIAIAILGMAGRGPTARGIETKTVRHRATTIRDAQRRYSADAAQYTTTGWAVHHVAWDLQVRLPTLVATYARYAEGDLRLGLGGWSLPSPRGGYSGLGDDGQPDASRSD